MTDAFPGQQLDALLLATMRRLRRQPAMRARLARLKGDEARAKCLADAAVRELREDERALALMTEAADGAG
jgi:hypothetical protein